MSGHVEHKHQLQNSHTNHEHHGTFFVWLFKKIPEVFSGCLSFLWPLFIIIGSSVTAVILFLKDVEAIKNIVMTISIPVVVLIAGNYMTLLPVSIICLLSVLSATKHKKYAFIALGTSAFFSSFVVFLV